MAKWKATIVTHTDLDGVGAAAVYIKLGGLVLGVDTRLVFAEPHSLDRALDSLDANTEKIVISDLGFNPRIADRVVSLLEKYLAKGVVVEWYDHHRWREEWVKKLESIGVKIYIDTTTCATGVVARYAPGELGVERDEYTESFVQAVCAADLWKWDHPAAPKLYRVVYRYRGPRGDEWRRELIRGFAEGAMWWPDLDEALHEYIRLEFANYSKALSTLVVEEYPGCRIGYVLKPSGPPTAGILAASLMARRGLDAIAVVKTNSRGISLRSRGRVDVQRIAVERGGGGHPSAAGMPLVMPWYASLIARLYPKIKLRYARKAVEEALRSLGECPLQNR